MAGNFPGWLFPILEHARLGKDDEEEREERKYINYYRCPYDGTEWVDVWSCCCNDMCPKCETKDIEPYKSEDIVHTKIVKYERTTKRKKVSRRS
jgi:hypothetical protein